jgi:long-chain acyl-CoA synthetase
MTPLDTIPEKSLHYWAIKTPLHPAVECGNTTLTYAELDQLANRIANIFRNYGLQRGHHVASLITNRPETLAIAWAAYRSGLYLTPIPSTLSSIEAAYIVDNCDAQLVIADVRLAALAATLPGTVPGCPCWLSFGGTIDWFTPIEPLITSASSAPIDECPGALMVYTSGTTGVPKGIFRPLPPIDFIGTPAFAADILSLFELDGSDVRYLSTAPLYHSAPLRFSLAVTSGGGTVYVMDRFDPELALRLIEQKAITHSQWVPAMFQRILALPRERRAAFRAPAHRMAVYGAAPCTPALKQEMIDWWGPILLEYYSGSEGIGLTTIDSDESRRKRGSVGRARKGTVHIVDESGKELPPESTGLIYFSGIAPFAYFKDPDKTQSRTLAQGWQTFGDVGYTDSEGYLYLTDRQDDMIISGGVNLYPQEIEIAIREVPGVWDCAVIGVPDELFGERVVAFIVPAHDRENDVSALIDAIKSHNNQRLGRYKRPSEIYTLESFPRSAAGKLLRKQLLILYKAM